MYDANYSAAVRRAEAKVAFFAHLAIYICVNACLISIQLWRGHARLWLLAPMFGWGIGLLFHGLRLYWRLPLGWKQHLIDQELKRKH